MTTRDSFGNIARQRSRLAHAMGVIEDAAASPAGKKSWLPDLGDAARSLSAAFTHHIDEVQSPHGLLDRIVEQAPRLQRAVQATRDEHDTIIQSINALLEMTDAESPSDPEDIREAVVATLTALTKHRQRGADLLYDAYDIDIGGY